MGLAWRFSSRARPQYRSSGPDRASGHAGSEHERGAGRDGPAERPEPSPQRAPVRRDRVVDRRRLSASLLGRTLAGRSRGEGRMDARRNRQAAAGANRRLHGRRQGMPQHELDDATRNRARVAAYELGFNLGLVTGARNAGAGDAADGATTREERDRLARELALPRPGIPPLRQLADALHEFEVYMIADPECIGARLERGYSREHDALYRFGAFVGHSLAYRGATPQLGPLFVADLRRYGQAAGPSERSVAPAARLPSRKPARRRGRRPPPSPRTSSRICAVKTRATSPATAADLSFPTDRRSSRDARLGKLARERRQGTAVQLVVDGQPFLIRGGELGNSTASNSSYLQPFWTRFAELNLNTVLAPVYWDLVEPEEGRFDFSLLDRLVAQARSSKMRLVLLWFGSWKNSMSCYAPRLGQAATPRRFPRATDRERHATVEILTPFSRPRAADADARAFAALHAAPARRSDGASAHRRDGPGRERDRHDPQRRATTPPQADRAFAASRSPRAHRRTSAAHERRARPAAARDRGSRAGAKRQRSAGPTSSARGRAG